MPNLGQSGIQIQMELDILNSFVFQNILCNHSFQETQNVHK
jgi:hypothetical protein